MALPVMPSANWRPAIRPRQSPGRRLDAAARACLPAAATLLLMLLTQLPLDIAGQAPLLPAVALCCVWFWSLSSPENLPPPVVLLIGLVVDLLGYLPPGVAAFTFLALQGLAKAVGRGPAGRGPAGRGPLRSWLVFAVAATAASTSMWLLVMLLTFRLLDASAAVFTSLLAVALFPALAALLAAAHRCLAEAGRD